MNKNYICHWGIKGQKWGIRRYQNEDGTLTPEGKAKYGTADNLKAQVKGNNRIKAGIKGLLATTAVMAVPASMMIVGKELCNEKMEEIGSRIVFSKGMDLFTNGMTVASWGLMGVGAINKIDGLLDKKKGKQ